MPNDIDYGAMSVGELLQDLYDSSIDAWQYAWVMSYQNTLDTIHAISGKIIEIAARLGITIENEFEDDYDEVLLKYDD